jgi:HlyD family secretion protein
VRRVVRWLLPLAVFTAAVLVVLRLVRPRGAVDVRDVPTFTVVLGPFTRTVTADGVLKPVRTTVISAPTESREPLMIAWMLEDGDPVKKGDVVVRFDAGEVARKLADGQSERAVADGRMAKEKTLAETTLHERDRAANLTRDELERARQLGKKDPRYFPRTEVIESEIDDALYERRLAHARDARKIEERLARSKMGLVAIERRKADLVDSQARAAMNSLELRAPHDGTFVMQRWGFRGTLKSGDRAFPGMRIAEISTNDRMDAEVFVLESDAGGLAGGRRAQVVLEARPDVTWKAKVKRVDAFPKQRQPEVPTQYFATLLTIEGDTRGLKPGQRLRATIILEEQAQALAVPRQAVFRRDNATIVYRRQGNKFVPVKVRLGPGTVGRLVIADGVKPGDALALRDPTLSADEAVNQRGAKVQREVGGGGDRGRGDRGGRGR